MESKIVYLFGVAMLATTVMAYPFPQGLPALPKPGPNGNYAPDHYFQYTNVPAPKVFEWGYRRGNDPEHFREEYLSQKDHTFKAKLRWGDAYEGQGEMFYDINHGPSYAPAPHKAPAYPPPPPKYPA